MNAYADTIAVLNRIAFGTSVRRTRTDEQARLEVNGGTLCDLKHRVRDVIQQLETVADDLEKTLP